MKTTRRRNNSRGNAMIEFAFTLLLSVPLILGILAIGIRYVRDLKVGQVSRDVANMYARGTNFNAQKAQELIDRLSPGINMTTTGDGVVILSKVTKVSIDDCTSHKVSVGECLNKDKIVYIQRIVLGNQAIKSSKFGTPSPLIITKDPYDIENKSTDVADRFRTPSVQVNGLDSVITLNGGQTKLGADGKTTITLAAEIAYVVEVVVNTTDLNIPGFMPQTQVYSRSIF